MVPLRVSMAFAVALFAVGVFYSRASQAARRRTTQSFKAGRVESSIDRNGFGYEMIERSDPASDVPTSKLKFWFYPNSVGAYNGKDGSPPLHVHLYDDEEFTILEGEMGYIVDGKEGILKPGKTALLPAGTFHTFWNSNSSNAMVQTLRLINRSGRHTPDERFFEQWASNGYDSGSVDKSNPLQLLAILQHNGIELALPYPARLFIRHTVVPFANLLGFKGFYPEYQIP